MAATTTALTPAATAGQSGAVKDKGKQKKSKANLKQPENVEEKRPGTTEWEKFADMLAQIRKFNPHDAFRRGGTYTKFGGAGIGHVKERPFVLGQHARGSMEDDNSDTATSFRDSPQNPQRSSARALAKVQHLPNRPNTGNNRRKAGGHYAHKKRRSSNTGSTAGRKFDYNPARSRVNEVVSCTPCIESSLLQNTADTQMPYALYPTSYESIINPPNARSHHSRSDMIALPPLEMEERARSRSQPLQTHQHSGHSSSAVDHNGNSMPLANDFYTNDVPIFTRQSTNISLSSTSSEDDNFIKSSNLDVKLPPPKSPIVKNTSSFLATPRSPFSLRKSYTDLYFSTTCNKENKPNTVTDKSPFPKSKISSICMKKQAIK